LTGANKNAAYSFVYCGIAGKGSIVKGFNLVKRKLFLLNKEK
jgi:hypothetical protein